MKKVTSSHMLFILGFLILVLTNIMVFSGVTINRKGQPEALIVLTERELRVPYRNQKENSGLALNLTWRILGKPERESNYSYSRSPKWLDRDKLASLGYAQEDLAYREQQGPRYRQRIAKEIFIVLEKNGKPYQQFIKRLEDQWLKEKTLFQQNLDNKQLQQKAEYAEQRFQSEQISGTRLFVIDAGLNSDQLREKYPDRDHFIITKGQVQTRYSSQEKMVIGDIVRLSIETIHVPLQFKKTLDQILDKGNSTQNKYDSRPPRFEIELAYGHRFEPWLVAVRPLEYAAD